MADVRVTPQTAAVLKALLDAPEGALYGLQIAQMVSLPTGSVYPILARLEHARWVSSEWEDVDPSYVGRHRRRFYRLTDPGIHRARRALESVATRWTVIPRVLHDGLSM